MFFKGFSKQKEPIMGGDGGGFGSGVSIFRAERGSIHQYVTEWVRKIVAAGPKDPRSTPLF